MKAAQPASKDHIASARVRSQPLPAAYAPKFHGIAASLLDLPQTHGNRFVQRLLNGATIKRKCACGGTCNHCRAESAQREQDMVQSILQRKSNGQPLDPGVRTFMETRFGEDFSQVRVDKSGQILNAATHIHAPSIFRAFADGKNAAPVSKATKSSSTTGKASREECDKKCGIEGGPFGNAECALNLETGWPTNKVIKEIFDTNPCTRPCVDVHESVHVKHITPVCKEVHNCLDKAGSDEKKQDKCLDNYEASSLAKTFGSECEAYKAEEKCLTSRKAKAECKTKEGKSRWEAQMNMVKCYKGCFCST